MVVRLAPNRCNVGASNPRTARSCIRRGAYRSSPTGCTRSASSCNAEKYKWREKVERFFRQIKQFRCITTCHYKLGPTFLV